MKGISMAVIPAPFSGTVTAEEFNALRVHAMYLDRRVTEPEAHLLPQPDLPYVTSRQVLPQPTLPYRASRHALSPSMPRTAEPALNDT